MIAAGLLLSRGMISIGFIAFMSNWIIEGNYHEKWNTLKKNKEGAIISIIFLMHLVGMLNTENIPYGLSELKVKLPLLLPLFYASSKKLIATVKPSTYLYIFIAATFIASLISFIRFEYRADYLTIEDLYGVALVGENIQLSLFVNMSIFASFYLSIKNTKWNLYLRVLFIINGLWQIVYLYIINSLTGHISFAILLIFSIFYMLKGKRNGIITAGLAVVISCFFVVGVVQKEIKNFNTKQAINFSELENYTPIGHKYSHDTLSKRTENGYYIDIYICKKELEKEWKKISNLPYNGKDKKGQKLSETLIRYLSSKGLKKDSAGIHSLSPEDIVFIENGCANYKYTNKYSPESRIYNILWQLDKYFQTGNATAQSISQRIEFLKSAGVIIKENFWFGVGTGDVMDVFNYTLGKTSAKLEKKYRNRVHNQYIVEFTALGVFGFLLFLFITFYPIIRFKIWKNYLFSAFYLIILLSYFTDNTLETQMGISFYVFFFSLFCFDYYKLSSSKE